MAASLPLQSVLPRLEGPVAKGGQIHSAYLCFSKEMNEKKFSIINS